jgi:hypothetical protein
MPEIHCDAGLHLVEGSLNLLENALAGLENE